MKISGYTFVRNATKLYIPVKESIASILPLVDEFVIALGKGDEDDRTEEEIRSLESSKIRIIHTEWESDKFPRNTIFARQTDIAKEACTGDWLFYLQCDEAIHERYHPEIKEALETYLDDREVEGFVFYYKHFWGDFDHYNASHVFYHREIRIIRNLPEIHSWRDAQSFRYHEEPFEPTFENYQKKEGTRKLKVAQLKAEVYHYGWARPPEVMAAKNTRANETYHGREKAKELATVLYDYGPLDKMEKFRETHPATMKNWVGRFYWKDQLRYKGKINRGYTNAKHEKFKYRLLSWIENKLLGGKQVGEFKNFVRIR